MMKMWMAAAMCGVSTLAIVSPAQAQAQRVRYDIPAGDLKAALDAYVRRSGQEIMFKPDEVRGVRSKGARGMLSNQAALAAILARTGFVVQRDPSGSVAVVRAGARRKDSKSTAANDRAPAPAPAAEQPQEVVVVGSRIAGTRLNEALPVTVIDQADLDAIGAVDGDDVYRAIAQMGDVGFNEADSDNGGINNARGDVASIDLRSIGTGNTLVLLNGRRLVPHPGTQVESFVPVQTVNTNAIPVFGLRRVEVLADGAAALYGTDAVAGVVNNVLRDNFRGFTAQIATGQTDGGMSEYSADFQIGKTFNGGKTNISVMGSYLTRDPLFIYERDYATVAGRVARFNGRAQGLDYGSYSTLTAWAEGVRLNPTTYRPAGSTTRINGQTLTSTAGTFHIQPSTNPGCLANGFIAGTCFDNSILSTTGEDRNLRYDIDTMRTISSSVDRVNLFTFINHDFGNGIEFFGELGYYWGKTWSQRQQDTPLDMQRVLMSPTAYWNPLGAVGVTARLPGLTTGTGTTAFPSSGAAVQVQDFRFSDLGYRAIDVQNVTTRFLGGLRGQWRGFAWESALLYSKASTDDTMDGISMTALQSAINLTTPVAYNPFVGGDLNSPKDGAVGLNDPATIEPMMVKVYRKAETQLMLWDFKLSRGDLLAVPAGDIGIAAGLEARRETYSEDRDPRLDGTITFTDLAGQVSQSDVMGVSYTPDSKGARNVYSGFLELAVPVVSPDMDVPFIRSIDVQLAGRVENYSLFGWVGAPKAAMAYRPNRWLMFRGSWSQGFRAPNLLQLHQPDFERSNSRRDYAACAVQLKINAISSLFSDNAYCDAQDRIESRSGNKNLQAENSENLSFGAVLEPKLWSRKYGELTLTVDYWKIHQKNLVGIFGGTNQLIMDYYLRQIGSSNPNIVRAAPDDQQIADAAAAGLAPVGTLLSITDEYMNLQPRKSAGLDFRLFYNVRNTPLGNWRLSVNASQKLKLYQQASDQHKILLDALAAGTISGVVVGGVENLIRRNGRPEWRVSASLTWSRKRWTAGWFTSYVSDFYDTSATYTGTTDPWIVDDWMTHNVFVQYQLPRNGPRLRIGARNVFNVDPPLADDRFGFVGSVHSNRGRWWYASLRTSF
ncbi:TonB-dependent receptor domain-containing protein [Sphingomonas floccifaciens]|uniref:TonB-dependent receptor domain-containing protein n=1 Tax=Sphingomonas floccifaciens TaxID=1844115 RepID=A0ABW4NDM4_9SPHN